MDTSEKRRLLSLGRCRLWSLLVLFLLATAPVLAQTHEEIKQTIDQSQAQIDRLRQEIARLQQDLNAAGEQKQTLQNAIKSIDLQTQKLTKSITLTNAQIAQKDREIRGLAGDISETSADIAKSQSGVAASLRELEAIDRESLAGFLLAEVSLSSLFDQAVALSALRSELQNRIEDLSAFKTNLQDTKANAEQKRRELSALQARLSQEKRSLTVARAEQDKLLTETKNKESNYQAIIAQKREEQARFESELFELSSKLGGVDASRIPRAAPGVLRWPLDSAFVTQRFGRTFDSVRLYASGTHDGVDFRAAVGAPVRAALSGTVVEVNHGAVPYCQYGKWLLIRHDNGLSTLYAHLSNIGVGKGQVVATGEVIGYAGNTGFATGPHLHFTVYLSETVAFKQYTCKSGRTVTIPIAPTKGYLDPLAYLPAL